jgi:membrane-associated protease RseP (regulator of RpoE activity)
VQLKVIRDAAEKSFDFVLGERPRELEGRFAPRALLGNARGGALRSFSLGGPALGVRTLELENAALAEYFGAEPGEGVLVTDVVEDSGAEAAGIQGGDVILAIGQQSISSVDDLREVLSEYDAGDEVEVSLRRKQRDQTVKVELSESALSFSGLGLPSHAWVGGDDVGDLRREVRELKRDLQRLEREMRRR